MSELYDYCCGIASCNGECQQQDPKLRRRSPMTEAEIKEWVANILEKARTAKYHKHYEYTNQIHNLYKAEANLKGTRELPNVNHNL